MTIIDIGARSCSPNPTRSRASFPVPCMHPPGFFSPQVRFVLNLPEAELSSADRLFFQVRQQVFFSILTRYCRNRSGALGALPLISVTDSSYMHLLGVVCIQSKQQTKGGDTKIVIHIFFVPLMGVSNRNPSIVRPSAFLRGVCLTYAPAGVTRELNLT